MRHIDTEIVIECRVLAADALLRLLTAQRDWGGVGVRFSLRGSGAEFRGLDTTVLVALVGVSGTAVGAIISGLLQVLKETHTQKVVLQAKNGRRIEVPATMPQDQVDQLIAKLDALEGVQLRIE